MARIDSGSAGRLLLFAARTRFSWAGKRSSRPADPESIRAIGRAGERELRDPPLSRSYGAVPGAVAGGGQPEPAEDGARRTVDEPPLELGNRAEEERGRA